MKFINMIFELFDTNEKCIKDFTSININYNKLFCKSHNAGMKIVYIK